MFEVFRRRRKTLLAALTLMAMFAFAFPVTSFFSDSSVDPRDKERNTVVATINGRDITRAELEYARSERRIANQFIESVLIVGDPRLANLANLPPQIVQQYIESQKFGSIDTEAIQDAIRMAHKADEYGIKVSDEMVRDFLREKTGGRLTNEQFQGILKSLGRTVGAVSADNLFEILRSQIRIQRVFELGLGLGLGRIRGGSPQVTPFEAWQFYRKLHDKVTLDVVSVKVSDFVADIADPGDAALRETFAKYVSRLPDPDSPEPGFKEPRKVNVQYATASLEAFLLAMRPEIQITEDELKHYYDSRKHNYLIVTPKLDDVAEPVEVPEKPKMDESAPPDTDAPKTNAKDDSPNSDSEGFDDASPEQSSARATPRGAALEQATGDETNPANEKPQELTKPTEAQGGTEQDPKPIENPDNSAAQKDQPGPPARPSDEPKYKPFEEVKEEIAEKLARQRARDELLKRMKKVQALVNRFAYDEFLPKKEQFEKEHEVKKDVVFTPPEPPDFTNDIELLGLKFAETGLIGFADELPKVEGFGHAMELAGETPTDRGVRSVLNSADLYDPLEFVNFKDEFFVAWKVADKPEREPAFNEVRDIVLAAYRVLKAREPAKSHANKLAESLRAVGGDLNKLRESTPEIESISVPSVPLWSDSAPNPFFGPSRVEPSVLPGIDKPGDEIRNTLFQMREGDIAVAANQLQDTYYVVVLTARETASLESFARSRMLVEMQVRAQLSEQQRLQWLSDLRSDSSRGKTRSPAGN